MFLPRRLLEAVENTDSPYFKSYDLDIPIEVWENDPDYCNNVVKPNQNFSGGGLLDLVEQAVFDFIAGELNMSVDPWLPC